jgi:hypothetical protein
MPPHVGPAPATVTVTVTGSYLVESSVDVAVMVGVSAPVFAGVKVTGVPEATLVVALRVPSAVGFTEIFTVFEYAPVPVTVGVQEEV